jgi:V/A-type H+-transporting ATPase subunit A
VGEDVLPDSQRLTLEMAKVLKIGFLQQNAYHKDDAYVPMKKQYRMLKVIEKLYDLALLNVKKEVSISLIKNKDIFESLYKMKYTVPNDDLSQLDEIAENIDLYYGNLYKKYSGEE